MVGSGDVITQAPGTFANLVISHDFVTGRLCVFCQILQAPGTFKKEYEE